MPVLHLIAGPHGSGKSALYRYLLAPRYPQLPFIDAVANANERLQHVHDPEARATAAREWAESRWQALLRERSSFIAESGFSHPSRVALVGQARTMGFEVVLYALALDEPRRLLQRLNQRVREGGHAIPSHKVLERYPRTLEYLRHAVYLADMALLMDAVDVQDGGPRLVASVLARQMHLHTVQRPRWAEKVLGFAEG